MEKVDRKVWRTPRASRYGSFAEATTGCDKKLGSSDGFTFLGLDIVCASP